jgi:hypothetical protein
MVFVVSVLNLAPLPMCISARLVEPPRYLTVLFLVVEYGSRMSRTIAPKELAVEVAPGSLKAKIPAVAESAENIEVPFP